jgi:hypothetical protein
MLKLQYFQSHICTLILSLNFVVLDVQINKDILFLTLTGNKNL